MRGTRTSDFSAPRRRTAARTGTRGALVASLLGLILAGSAAAAVSARRHVVAGGGSSSNGGPFVLRGTAGQPEADALDAGAGALRLQGGYWASASLPDDRLFADGFEP